MRGRMFQTLFQDGSRLITTDLGSSAKQRERPSHIDWMDIGPEVSNLAALEIHQDRLELRKRERNIPCVQLQSFNDYRTFPEKFPHKGQ